MEKFAGQKRFRLCRAARGHFAEIGDFVVLCILNFHTSSFYRIQSEFLGGFFRTSCLLDFWFVRAIRDALILDDVRDFEFLSVQQHALQGKYHVPVEFGTTAGGTCAYKRDLYAVPIVATANYCTKNLGYLETHDWLGKAGNRVVVRWKGITGVKSQGDVGGHE